MMSTSVSSRRSRRGGTRRASGSSRYASHASRYSRAASKACSYTCSTPTRDFGKRSGPGRLKFFCVTFSPRANFTVRGAPWKRSWSERSICQRILMTALSPPMGLALPWRISADVTPPERAW